MPSAEMFAAASLSRRGLVCIANQLVSLQRSTDLTIGFEEAKGTGVPFGCAESRVPILSLLRPGEGCGREARLSPPVLQAWRIFVLLTTYLFEVFHGYHNRLGESLDFNYSECFFLVATVGEVDDLSLQKIFAVEFHEDLRGLGHISIVNSKLDPWIWHGLWSSFLSPFSQSLRLYSIGYIASRVPSLWKDDISLLNSEGKNLLSRFF
jgi:hypothetical protein